MTAARGVSKSSILLPPLGTGVENLPWSGLPRKEEVRETGTPGAKDHAKNKKSDPVVVTVSSRLN